MHLSSSDPVCCQLPQHSSLEFPSPRGITENLRTNLDENVSIFISRAPAFAHNRGGLHNQVQLDLIDCSHMCLNRADKFFIASHLPSRNHRPGPDAHLMNSEMCGTCEENWRQKFCRNVCEQRGHVGRETERRSEFVHGFSCVVHV